MFLSKKWVVLWSKGFSLRRGSAAGGGEVLVGFGGSRRTALVCLRHILKAVPYNFTSSVFCYAKPPFPSRGWLFTVIYLIIELSSSFILIASARAASANCSSFQSPFLYAHIIPLDEFTIAPKPSWLKLFATSFALPP